MSIESSDSKSEIVKCTVKLSGCSPEGIPEVTEKSFDLDKSSVDSIKKFRNLIADGNNSKPFVAGITYPKSNAQTIMSQLSEILENDYNYVEGASPSNNASDIRLYEGVETQKTTAHAMNTLFVVGIQTPYDILDHIKASQNAITHIYFGANGSFKLCPREGMSLTDTAVLCDEFEVWDAIITTFLKLGYWVTLEFDVAGSGMISDSKSNEYHKFIPLARVIIPDVKKMNYNTVIKIDGNSKQINPRVWFHHLHSDLIQNDKGI
jgi:hypothetical protein